MTVPALYFDGKTSRPLAVELSVQGGLACISGEAQRQCRLSELRVSERLNRAARKVTFPDGAYLEILDNAAFHLLLDETGHRDSLVVRAQQSWRGTLVACVITIALLVVSYLYLLPALSKMAAQRLPEEVQRAIGRNALDFLDKQILAPSQLPAARQEAIVARFRSLIPPREGVPLYRIVFRKSRIGPNAFALPSGIIVLTDDIVTLVDNDDAVMGILAHELGHVHERHLLRRMIQGSAIGAVATVLFGDVSSVVANIPTLLLDLRYSREAEREADDYAIAMLKANGIALSNLILVFEKLKQAGGDAVPYLSSHPPAAERIARIRAAQ